MFLLINVIYLETFSFFPHFLGSPNCKSVPSQAEVKGEHLKKCCKTGSIILKALPLIKVMMLDKPVCCLVPYGNYNYKGENVIKVGKLK